jgi:hypothetical protein
MAKVDAFDVTVMPDGLVKIEAVGAISAPNHASAENLLSTLATMLGGDVERTKLPHKHVHVHEHEHIHEGGKR